MQLSQLSDLKQLSEEMKEHGINNVLALLDDKLKQKVTNKEKLTIDEQITYLRAKGIQFEFMSENDAKTFLKENSYYYKLTSYKYNFKKDSEGFYVDLDFAIFKDLSTIDMHLRYLVLKLSLDIEHALKSMLINLITSDEGEDGYKIIEEYNSYEKTSFLKNGHEEDKYIHVKDKIFKEVGNTRDYNFDAYNRGKLPIWKLIEMMSYGQLSSFIKFYYETYRYKSKSLKKAYQFLHYSKNIRDYAAHSRPILMNVTVVNQLKNDNTKHKQKEAQANSDLKDYVSKHRNKKDRRMFSNLLTNFRIHDLCCLIVLHDEYVSGKYMRKSRKKEMLKVYKRAFYKEKIYKSVEFKEIMCMFFEIIRKYSIIC